MTVTTTRFFRFVLWWGGMKMRENEDAVELAIGADSGDSCVHWPRKTNLYLLLFLCSAAIAVQLHFMRISDSPF